MIREPSYCHHRGTGQAYVRLNGKVFYLGAYGSEESKSLYNRLKSEWLLNRHASKFHSLSSGPTMAELALAYLDHAEVYYGPGTELANLKLATGPVSELYATLPTKQFGPSEFETVRNWWLKRPNSRKNKDGTPKKTASRQYVNAQMKRLVRIIKWGVAKGMVPASVHQTLKCVDPLKRGRCGAPESEPVKPVSQASIDSTLPHLTQVVADMVRVQLLLGCRPGEVCKLTPGMIHRDGDVWQIKLTKHKTAYAGKSRVIFAGPKAQAILKKYLLRGPDDPLFSPIESERQRRETAHSERVTPLSEGNRPGKNLKKHPKRAPRTAFDTQSYSKSILYATRKAKIEAWSANQLRHTRATEIRSLFGLEAAASILGHSEIGVTQVYAEADMQRAIEVAKKTG